MRTINIDLSHDRKASYDVFGGNAGEHNETQLVVTLPSRLLSSDISYYYFEFQTATGEHITSPNIYKNQLIDQNKVAILLWEQLMLRSGDLRFCITAISLNKSNEITVKGKTHICRIKIADSPEGCNTLIDTTSAKEELQSAIDNALQEAKDSGEFKGDPGTTDYNNLENKPEKRYRLGYETVKLGGNIKEAPSNLCLIAAKVIHHKGTVDLFDAETVTEGVSISSTDGAAVAMGSCSSSDYIEVSPLTSYTFTNRRTLAWYDENKAYISGIGSSDTELTVTSPEGAKYMRFAWWNSVTTEKHVYKTTPEAGKAPKYEGYLLLDKDTDKLYYASPSLNKITYLCDWNTTVSNGAKCSSYLATVTAQGDIIFLRCYVREAPIIYPHTDYTAPYRVDFGDSLKPYGFLSSASIVQFDDGSFVFGDYAKHSLQNEQNNDPRRIWRAVPPYNTAECWNAAHDFRHVYYTSDPSDTPDNEIGHIHTVSYDFYSGILYCTTGDIDRHCRIWKSENGGKSWSAVVAGAVNTSGTIAGAGQKYRNVGFVFTEDGCYYGTDSFFAQHNLWFAPRTAGGEIDFVNIQKLCSLEPADRGSGNSQATYGTVLMRNPKGLLLLDRAEPRPDNLLDIPFYSFEDSKLYMTATFKKSIFEGIEENRNGLPNQCFTEYQPDALDGILCGSGTFVRFNTTDILGNASDNYIGLLKMKITEE